MNGMLRLISLFGLAAASPGTAPPDNTKEFSVDTAGLHGGLGALFFGAIVAILMHGCPQVPAVISTNPSDGDANVAVTTSISATFSEAMDPATITTATFMVTGPGGTAVSGAVTCSGALAAFTPAGNLAYDTSYTATITTGAKDPTGTALPSNFTWTFETGPPVPVVPAVTSTDPANGATDVPVGTSITAAFNEAMDPTTITTGTFTVTGPDGTAVSGAVTCTGALATFTPASNLAYDTSYTATITTGAKDPTGTPLPTNYPWTFTTEPIPLLTVTSTVPENGALNVPIDTTISATFNEALDPTTVTATSLTVTDQGGTPVSGTVASAGGTATFTPASNLAYNTAFIGKITMAVTASVGGGLQSDYTWTFTTAPPPALAVISTVPMNGESNVPITTTISATFNETLNSTTVTAANFMVTGPGGAAVSGTVISAGATATFTPAGSLAPNTQYTATLTKDIRSSSNDALASAYSWTFTTGGFEVSSTNPGNNATGVAVGTTAISATFNEAVDSSTLTSATFTLAVTGGAAVSGTVSSSGAMATLVPASSLAPNTSYTATITTGVRASSGEVLPSSFTWTFRTAMPPAVISTGPGNGATAVGTNVTITIILTEPMNPATITTSTVLVTGPGGTSVPGTVTCTGTVVIFTPGTTLAPNTPFSVTITTGAASSSGTPLQNPVIWTFRTGLVPDTTPPTVSSTTPANAETGVAINRAISVTFSEAMNPLTITTATFVVVGPDATQVPGTVTYAGTTATFRPTNNLAANTTYTATVTTGAEDLAGNALSSNFGGSGATFTTGAATDTTAPTVVFANPADVDTNVEINTSVNATFSEPMDPATLSGATFTVTGPGGTPVAGAVTYVGSTATFTPASELAGSTAFTATITTGAQDLAGNALASDFSWTFTSGTAPDATAPVVQSTSPADAATGACINTPITATFSEAMDELTITTATFTITGLGGMPVAGTVTYDPAANIATFMPAVDLAANTTFTVTISGGADGAKDLAGNALVNTKVWTFTTGTQVCP